jgi:hypothetical protein
MASSLMAEAQARLLTYCNEYTFDGMEYAPLIMYKIIIGLQPLTPLPPRRPCMRIFRT